MHDTAVSMLTCVPGLSLGTIVQLVPSHRSATVAPGKVCPTASQSVALRQSTESSNASPAGGCAIDVEDQADPFHSSAKTAVALFPTAMQKELVTHDTEISWAGTLGTGMDT